MQNDNYLFITCYKGGTYSNRWWQASECLISTTTSQDVHSMDEPNNPVGETAEQCLREGDWTDIWKGQDY